MSCPLTAYTADSSSSRPTLSSSLAPPDAEPPPSEEPQAAASWGSASAAPAAPASRRSVLRPTRTGPGGAAAAGTCGVPPCPLPADMGLPSPPPPPSDRGARYATLLRLIQHQFQPRGQHVPPGAGDGSRAHVGPSRVVCGGDRCAWDGTGDVGRLPGRDPAPELPQALLAAFCACCTVFSASWPMRSTIGAVAPSTLWANSRWALSSCAAKSKTESTTSAGVGSWSAAVGHEVRPGTSCCTVSVQVRRPSTTAAWLWRTASRIWPWASVVSLVVAMCFSLQTESGARPGRSCANYTLQNSTMSSRPLLSQAPGSATRAALVSDGRAPSSGRG